VDLEGRNFSSSNESTPGSDKWTFVTILDNQANITITIQHFTTSSSILFANTALALAANTLKLNVKIQNWPFSSSNNSLAVVLERPSSSDQIDSSSDVNGNLEWFTVTFNGTSLFGQFFPYAAVDGRTRILPFILNTSDGSVTALIPHFWQEVELDPNYSVLLESNQPANTEGTPRSKNPTPTILAAVLSTIFGTAVVICVAYFVFPRVRLLLQLRVAQEEVDMEKRRSTAELMAKRMSTISVGGMGEEQEGSAAIL